jgi:transcription elongation GreA/GreB family factor
VEVGAESVLAAAESDEDDLGRAAYDATRKGTARADAVVWLWRNRRREMPTAFTNPTAIFRVLGRACKGEFLKAQKELHRLLLDEPEFQSAVMNEGEQRGIANLVKATKATTALNKGEQQSLLVKIVRVFPEAQSLVEERSKVVARRPLPKQTSYRRYEEQQRELTDIINNQIPKNSAQIQLARSYGDLRENAEYKAAKQHQRLLYARRTEIEKGLTETMPTDFAEVVVIDNVIPGSTVTLDYGSDQEAFHVLGLWDSVPEEKKLSYETPLGRVLINKKVGESVTTPQGRQAEIIAIEPLSAELRDWVKGDSD